MDSALTAQAERAVYDVCIRYASALDNRDWDLLRTCFRPDAVVSYDGIAECAGHEAIEATCRQALEPFGRTQHLLGNFSITVSGDAAEAQCYVQAQHVRAVAGRSRNVTLVGRYSDQLVRVEDRWQIARRRLEVWWTARADVCAPP